MGANPLPRRGARCRELPPAPRAAARAAAAPAAVQRAADPLAAAVAAGGGPVPGHVLALAASGLGAPLDPAQRAYFEPRLGADLSHVRVHRGASADASTRALGALAWTAGSHVAVRGDAWAPATPAGRRLLAHELAHTLQQSGRGASPAPGVNRPGDAAEREAEVLAGRATSSPAAPARWAPRAAPADGAARAVQRHVPELPGYSQEGDSCGAASLVSALMIWDKQRAKADAPNELVVTACNLILTWMTQWRQRTIDGWNAKGAKGEELYKLILRSLMDIRDRARAPGAAIGDGDYKDIGTALYFLYVDKQAGLSASAISSLQTRLGLETGTTSAGAMKWDDIIGSPVVTGLKPGQIAQAGWYVRTTKPDAEGKVKLGHHAFLIGRLNDGRWFLSDQGMDPPTELTAADLPTLDAAIRIAAREGRSWIHTGAPETIIAGTWTGVKLLAGPAGVRSKAAALVPKGTELAEIDAGVTTTGQTLVAGDFVSTHYALADASAVGTGSGGLLIVEMPQGVFNVWRTNPVSDDNLKATGIDEGDSKGMLLATHTFFHAWLRLCSAQMCKAQLIQVY